VEFLGPVEAQTDQKVVFMKELTPLIVEEDAVRLEGVLDSCTWLCISFLELHGAPVEIDPHESWLSALPRYCHLRDLVSFEKLPYIGLVDLIRHPEAASEVEFLFFQEEAVVATEIAGRSRRFGHDMEGLRNFRLRHGLSPLGFLPFLKLAWQSITLERSVFGKHALHTHFLADLKSFLHNKGRATGLSGSDHRAYQKLAKAVFKLKLAKIVFELTYLQSDQ